MRRLICLLPAAVAALSVTAGAQQMDMQAVQRWSSAKTIFYAVEGIFADQASMTATMGGVGDVRDRVTMSFEWNLSESKLVKLLSLNNYPSEVKNLRDREPTCLAPTLKGTYEHATVLEVTNGLGGALDMKVERSYPAVDVAQSCTASRKSIPAQKKTEMQQMGVPSPILIAMGAPTSGNVSYTADKKSIIVKDRGWTWTFTPGLAAPK